MAIVTSRPAWVILITCMIENILFTGYVGNWNLLTELYRSELYVEGCPKGSFSNCILQDNKFELVVTLSTLSRGFAVLLVSYLIEKWGIRITKTMASVQIAIGATCLVFCNHENEVFFMLGSLFISTGGGQLFFANLTTAELFPQAKLAVMGLYSGGHFISALFIPHAFWAFSTRVISKDLVSCMWAFMSLLSVAVTWCLYSPRNVVGHKLNLYHVSPEVTGSSSKNDGYTLLQDRDHNEDLRISVNKHFGSNRSQSSSLLTVPYMLFVGWACCNLLCICLYETIYLSRMKKSFPEESLFDSYTLAFILASLSSVSVVPLCILVLDFATLLEKEKHRCWGLTVLVLTSILVASATFYHKFETFRGLQTSLVFLHSAKALSEAVTIIYIRYRFAKDEFLFLVAIQILITTLFGKLKFPLEVFYSEYPTTAIGSVATVQSVCIVILIAVFSPSFIKGAYITMRANLVKDI